jgi:DNA repair and recombination protein RAD52
MNRNGIKNERFAAEGAVRRDPFTPAEISEIQAKLDKRLGPEYVSTRPGGGGVRVSYIEGWKAINLANQVFGFHCWSSDVKTINVDFVDEKQGRFNVGLSVTVRVTLKDGSYHEDIGYGSIENSKSKAQAFEKAKKEAMTDGLKRALRHFGNALGNCLYDKEYLSKISGVRCAPPDFDEAQLMRHSDYNNPPSRATTIPAVATLDRRSENNVSIPPRATSNQAPPDEQPRIPEKRTLNTPHGAGSKRFNRDPDDFDDSLTFSDDLNLESEDFNDEVNELLNSKSKTPAPSETSEPITNTSNPTTRAAVTNQESSAAPVPQNGENITIPTEVGFFKARVAEDVQKNTTTINPNTAFNPQFISPSIRRTVDPTKSTPIKRPQVNENKTIRYDSPNLIPNRQIGKPRYPPPRKTRTELNENDQSTSA